MCIQLHLFIQSVSLVLVHLMLKNCLQADFSINVHIVSFQFNFQILSTPSGTRLITVLD